MGPHLQFFKAFKTRYEAKYLTSRHMRTQSDVLHIKYAQKRVIPLYLKWRFHKTNSNSKKIQILTLKQDSWSNGKTVTLLNARNILSNRLDQGFLTWG